MSIVTRKEQSQNRNRKLWGTHSAITAPLILAGVLVLFHSYRALGQTSDLAAPKTQLLMSPGDDTMPTLVIGFLGGFVHRDDLRHSEVQLAQRLRAMYGSCVQVEVFRNREKVQAHESIVAWLNRLEDNTSAEQGKPRYLPRLILFGHSWGASAVVYIARELEQEHIPVALTIQVDSVRKHGENDSVIPANVSEAVNFYQSRGILHGRSKITAADPSRTTILGNFRFNYEKQPPECQAYPWYNRLLFKGHTSIECDPQVWSQVERLIQNRLVLPSPPTDSEVAAQIMN